MSAANLPIESWDLEGRRLGKRWEGHFHCSSWQGFMAIGSFPLVRSLSQAGAFYLEFSVYLDKLTLDEVASLVVSSHY